MRGEGKRKIKGDAIQKKESYSDALWWSTYQQSGTIGSIHPHNLWGWHSHYPIYQMKKPGFGETKPLLQTNSTWHLQWFVPFKIPWGLGSCSNGSCRVIYCLQETISGIQALCCLAQWAKRGWSTMLGNPRAGVTRNLLYISRPVLFRPYDLTCPVTW